jgi:hypothetical protein
MMQSPRAKLKASMHKKAKRGGFIVCWLFAPFVRTEEKTTSSDLALIITTTISYLLSVCLFVSLMRERRLTLTHNVVQ